MSVPPQVLKIKRKRDDDVPVTFLQLHDDAKRHRSDSDWAYRRRDAVPPSPAITSPHDARPVIHVSGNGSSPNKKRAADGRSHSGGAGQISRSMNAEQSAVPIQPARRFHISRSMLKNEASARSDRSGVSKRPRNGPAIFVERTRKKLTPKPAKDRRIASAGNLTMSHNDAPSANDPRTVDSGQTTRALKKPGATSRVRVNKDAPARAPLPSTLSSHHEEDMSKIADDLNKWMINEIGANLESIDQERRQAQSNATFRPKAPAQRYRDRHPQMTATPTISEPDSLSKEMDVDDATMYDDSDEDEDGDDWIIEEYIRIPLKSMAPDVLPTDVGVLVLDGEEATALFYGPENDSDDEFAEDDEDENAENHYTADYPEDEVDSEDEYGRQAYLYRTRNASDDEEFDNEGYESSDDMVLDGSGDDDATMARIKAYMRRHAARE